MEVKFTARNRQEYAEMLSAPVITRPLNRYWRRFVPDRLYVIGDHLAVIVGIPEVKITYRGESVTRTIWMTLLNKSERKLLFHLKADN